MARNKLSLLIKKEFVNRRGWTAGISRATDKTIVVTIDAEKLAKTLNAKREERTVLEARREDVNKNLTKGAVNSDVNKDTLQKFNAVLGSDTNSVKTPDKSKADKSMDMEL